VFVYLLSSKPYATLYIGVTNGLVRRIWEHKTKASCGFTEKYGTVRLIYFEQMDDPMTAITREKQLKKWRRAWKVELIEKANPDWHDLYPGIVS
jgi:putative endonuclease